MCEQYAWHLARNKPFHLSQVGVLDKEVLSNAYIFTEKYAENQRAYDIGDIRLL